MTEEDNLKEPEKKEPSEKSYKKGLNLIKEWVSRL